MNPLEEANAYKRLTSSFSSPRRRRWPPARAVLLSKSLRLLGSPGKSRVVGPGPAQRRPCQSAAALEGRQQVPSPQNHCPEAVGRGHREGGSPRPPAGQGTRIAAIAVGREDVESYPWRRFGEPAASGCVSGRQGGEWNRDCSATMDWNYEPGGLKMGPAGSDPIGLCSFSRKARVLP